MLVTARQESRTHAIVWSGLATELPDVDVVGRLFPSDIVSCVRSATDGDTTLSCAATDQEALFGAASAAATVKRSWGWDESPTIVVRFVSGPTFAVDPVPDGRAWSVARPRSG